MSPIELDSRFTRRHALRIAAIVLGAVVPAIPRVVHAQDYPQHPPMYAVIDTQDVRRSGPRYGVLFLSNNQGLLDTISRRSGVKNFPSTTSLFGWEFETQLLRNPGGALPVTDLVLAVAGLDQGTVIPTATWLVGMRLGRDAGMGLGNAELGIGPNISPDGAGLALAVGVTHRSGAINIPLDVAAVSSKFGWRVSVTTGFNVMK